MPQELTDPMPERVCSFSLVSLDAGVLQGNGVDGDGRVSLVKHDGHDLHLLESRDGFPVDVRDEVARSHPCLPRCPLLLHRLKRREG